MRCRCIMNDIILLKQGEMVLKGLNKRIFEQKLLANVNRRLAKFGEWNVYCIQSTVYIEPKGCCDMDGAFDAMKTIFGVASVSRAAAAPKDADAIVSVAKHYLADTLNAAKSFKVESKRADKSFPMTSIQLSQYVGGELHDAFPHLTVDVHNPELVVNVEIRDLSAYVHAGGEQGAGGLPVGTCGRAVTLLSGGIDSPVSTWMMARRGVELIPVHFFSPPYTSEAAKRKVLELARILLPWCGKLMVEIIPFTEIQEEIRLKCPEEYFTLIMRRFMMRLSENVAQLNGCRALITGENLGQVASQTMEALAVTENVCSLPILRPLIGMDKTEIIDRARRIGTFETSILPYEDCCTVFTPRHPKTKPRLEDVIAAESVLDIDSLVADAAANTERVRISE